MAKNNELDYEKIGRVVVSVSENGYKDKRKLYRISFFKGVATGIGSVVGATLGIALLLYLLTLIGEIPFIGTIADSIKDTINSSESL